MIFINILESVCLALEEEETKAAEIPPEHPDCDACEMKGAGDSCSNYKTCASFRAWFKHEWDNIREAANRLKGGASNDTK